MLAKFSHRLLAITVIMTVGALSIQTKTASAVFGRKLVDQTGCPCFTCPSCKHACDLESELVDAEKVCFETEEKVICIPRVVFPWQREKQSCCGCAQQPCSKCTHNGAKTRKICVLKTKKYTCPECEYTWSPKEKECKTGCGCISAGCASTGCASAPCDAAQWSSSPVTSDYEVGASEAYPWTGNEPVVSDLPQPHGTTGGPQTHVAQP